MKHFALSFFLTMACAGALFAWRAHRMEERAESSVAGAAPATVQLSVPASIPEAAKLESAFSQKFSAFAAGLNHMPEDPALEEQSAVALADQLRRADAEALSKLALDSASKNQERFAAVYLLAKRSDFFGELAAVAVSVPPSNKKREFEIALRIAAMQGIEGQYPDPEKLRAVFAQAREAHSDPFLRQLATVGEEGAKRGRSLVKNFLDAKLQGVGNAR